MTFMGAMLGLVLADNLITLFVFWELTSISSYLLIGFDHEKASARAAALKALLVTGHVNRAVIKEMFRAGAAGYIIKPFDEDELMRHIAFHFAEPHASC